VDISFKKYGRWYENNSIFADTLKQKIMKKLITNLFLGMALIASLHTQAQYCGASEITIGSCGVPPGTPGFENLDSIPCIQQGVFTTIILPFTNYTAFSAQGNAVVVHRLKLDTLSNFPCGMCWSTNKADNSFLGGEFGCVKIQGITNDPAGQYKIHMLLDVNTQDTTTNYGITDINADAGGVYLYVRVVAAGATSCTPVDTSSTAQRLTAGCDTFNLAAGIRNVPATLHDLTIQPNPVSTDAKVTFTSETGGTQQIRISNIIGSEVYSTTYAARQGANETTISRNGLPAGMYILSVGSNAGVATRKFIITE
jgi:hypothetical protein